MQSLAQTASEALRSPDRLDRVHLVGFGGRRKAEDLPRLLTESVAGEVVLVQAPVRDDDDRATAFVVERPSLRDRKFVDSLPGSASRKKPYRRCARGMRPSPWCP